MQAMPAVILDQDRPGLTSAGIKETLYGVEQTECNILHLVQNHISLPVAQEVSVLLVTALVLTTAQATLSLWYLPHRQTMQIVLLSFITQMVKTVVLPAAEYFYTLAGQTTQCILIKAPAVTPTSVHNIRLAYLICVILEYGHLEADYMTEVFS
jgi:hypothetical protein